MTSASLSIASLGSAGPHGGWTLRSPTKLGMGTHQGRCDRVPEKQKQRKFGGSSDGGAAGCPAPPEQVWEWRPGLEEDWERPQILPGSRTAPITTPPGLAGVTGTAAAPNCPHAGKGPGQPSNPPGLEGDRGSHKMLSGAGKEQGTTSKSSPGLEGDRGSPQHLPGLEGDRDTPPPKSTPG